MSDISESNVKKKRFWVGLALAMDALLLSAAALVWWWGYSGSLVPLQATVDGVAGTFSLAAPAPMSRSEAGGTALDGKLYLAGGLNPWLKTLTSFTAYDPATDRWDILPDVPEPLSHCALVAAEGKLYLTGGFIPAGFEVRRMMFLRWEPSDRVYVYDPSSKNWSQGPKMLEPRGAGGAAVAEGAIWYAGGIDAQRQDSADLFRLDLKTKTWTRETPMAVARDHLRMEALDGKLYSISGRKDDLRHNLPVVEQYDIRTGLWTRVADLPTARGGLSSAVLNGAIYVFGGEQFWGCIDRIERYDPRADRWDDMGRLPEARHGIVAGVIQGKIHMVSGGRHPRNSASRIHRILTIREARP